MRYAEVRPMWQDAPEFREERWGWRDPWRGPEAERAMRLPLTASEVGWREETIRDRNPDTGTAQQGHDKPH